MAGTRTSSEDPMLGRLLRTASGLRAGGISADVLATYHHDDGRRPFAFRRDGLLIDPEGDARFIPFDAIEDASYHDLALLRADKRSMKRGERNRGVLPLRLVDGEVIALPLNAHPEGRSERLTIARLIEQRACIARAKAVRAQGKAPSALGEGGASPCGQRPGPSPGQP
ncbi:MAG: hypothetical protein IIZ38_19080 [Sphingomonas sp.]|uniref:hypothetical protein n=1 Tax=Sphingomonas sp. TaxID=28214 RepID=UPI0025DE2930|nr:hypothetical protein [Sphingomonas sp.]MBQ1500415.1 hypothetical protein [Sphingomonas sp.]